MRHPNIHKLAPEEYIAWLHACIDYLQERYYADTNSEFTGVADTSEALKTRLPREAWIAYEAHALGRDDLDRIEEYLQKEKEEESERYTFKIKPDKNGTWFFKAYCYGEQEDSYYGYATREEAKTAAKAWVAHQEAQDNMKKPIYTYDTYTDNGLVWYFAVYEHDQCILEREGYDSREEAEQQAKIWIAHQEAEDGL
jgi:hypothetical protein